MSLTGHSLLDELIALADEKSAPYWKKLGVTQQGCVSAVTAKAADAAPMITAGIAAHRSAGVTLYVPFYLSILAHAQAELGQFDFNRIHIRAKQRNKSR